MSLFKSGFGSLVLLGACLLFAPFGALAQTVGFYGGGTIYNFSQPCIDDGWDGTPRAYQVRLTPHGVGANGNRDRINFFGYFQAFGFELSGGRFTSDFQDVHHVYMFSGVDWRSQTYSEPAQIRVIAMSPANLTEDTTSPVRIRGQIRHLAGTRWCRVNFDATVQRDP
jgi:hypothetical protein